MQRLIIIYLTIFSLIVPTQAVEHKDPFVIINDILLSEKIAIEQWEVTMKEQVNKKQANQLLNDHIFVLHNESAHATTYVLNNYKQIGTVTTNLKLIIPNNETEAVELIATISSHIYDEKTKIYYENVKKVLKLHYFSSSAQLFTCIKLNSDVIISENDYFKEIIEIFNINDTIIHEDTLKQHTHYQMLYGNTSLWDETIQVNDHSMNVHLVKRSHKQQETAFFIGTPILLNEY